ncbi:MAG: capsular polysaccharide synthesis protein, partial [Endomicrobiaceae bacterium]|nr:capsular polysaccharide synthesis protein [Endomicrobiaceae bacterium]
MINKPKIFTFWEPKEKIPAYIQLCIQTWNKFLPEYEINIVDYSNIDEYLGKNFYDNILYKDFPLSILSDIIKCALLKSYGGIWFDADTIITSQEAKTYINMPYEFVLIGQHLAFIKADKNSYILNKWLKEIKYRIEFYKNQKYNKYKLKSKIQRLLHPRMFTKISKWDYFGNSVLIRYLIPTILFNVSEKLNLSFLYKLFKKKNRAFLIDRKK